MKKSRENKVISTNHNLSTRNKLSISSKTATAGITLIALVITIIVLLILAGVTLGNLIGNNGIIENATKAKIKTEVREIEEQLEMSIVKSDEEKYLFGNLGDILRNQWSV